MSGRSGMLRWLSGLAWAGSWRIIYLEITRWRHLTKTLRFNPPPPPPGYPEPKAGLPLHAVRAVAIAAPMVFVATTIASRNSQPPNKPSQTANE